MIYDDDDDDHDDDDDDDDDEDDDDKDDDVSCVAHDERGTRRAWHTTSMSRHEHGTLRA